jgi:hypothetical protein
LITYFPRDLLLLWDWEQLPGESQGQEESKNWVSLDEATRTWNVALILGDLKEYEEAEKRFLMLQTARYDNRQREKT